MPGRSRLLLALALALPSPVVLALSGALGPHPRSVARAANTCLLDYQRADNMWADFGRADGGLGVETISLPVPANAPNTALKVFITDWRYEKQRNDGTSYYGSHLRIASNRGTMRAWLTVRSVTEGRIGLDPGERREFKHDLLDLWCQVL